MKVKTLFSMLILGLSFETHAYNHFPLTPSWFKTLHQGVTENKKEVWRGTVTNVIGPTSLMIQDTKGSAIKVELLHITLKHKATKRDLDISKNALTQMLGKQIYVASKPSKSPVSAKIIDATGVDINLELIANGYFDLNTTSLLMKREKQKYINARNNAIQFKLGIWH